MKKNRKRACCTPERKTNDCCKVESVITVDERGQMVIPKEVRDSAKINAGDKFALILMREKGKVCCISLIKVEELVDVIKDKLGLVFRMMS